MFFEKNVILHVIKRYAMLYLQKEGKQKGQQVGQKNLSIARVND